MRRPPAADPSACRGLCGERGGQISPRPGNSEKTDDLQGEEPDSPRRLGWRRRR
ncbi:hypothetical protein SLNWT_1499 [Streptomyces albus]|uniref:Uncharacterized protein n=1 Tax=Streptomyces albus (strain ATCC 21838 / DSM 41398 / FERM P-419 / JCM 4703 / NBRC 107858) TaxID=1081613 RepID=A0A0B5ERI4_STRA4|nr:hypothetical protein SLNWT_1499 [Streptomyces albus]AOU76191.1 hypothetical protein SLNHY_1500 [Streptomyces albus]